MDENLEPEDEPKDWKWQEMARHGQRQVRAEDHRDRLASRSAARTSPQHLLEQASNSINEVDLSKGAKYLDRDWGVHSLCEWVERQIPHRVDLEEFGTTGRDRGQGPCSWTRSRHALSTKGSRVPGAGGDEFVHGRKSDRRRRSTALQSRGALCLGAHAVPGTDGEHKRRTVPHRVAGQFAGDVAEISAEAYPKADQSEIDAHVDEAMSGTRRRRGRRRQGTHRLDEVRRFKSKLTPRS